jgi:DNA-binding transcriptional regulator YdaS (Cro superfamily)
MNLKDYLKSLTKAERSDFAERCESSVGSLNNLAYCDRGCSAKLAIAIERESGGKVRIEDLPIEADWNYLFTQGAALRLGRAA